MVDAALEVPGIWAIRWYVRRRLATIVEYVAERSIYELCTVMDKMEGYSRFLRWWDQEHGPTQAERELG